MKLRQKLLLAFVGVGATISMLSLLALRPLERGLRDVGEFSGPALHLVRQVQASLAGAIQESFAYVVSGEESERDDAREQLARSEDLVARYRELVEQELDPTRRAALIEHVLRTQWELAGAGEHMFAEYERTRAVGREAFAAYEVSVDRVLRAAAELEDVEQSELDAAQAAAVRTIDVAEWMFYGIAGFSVLLAVVAGVFFASRITRPIEQLRKAADELAAGHAQAVAVEGSDELAELSAAFNRMLVEVEGARGSLEEAVDERTTELLTSNEALRTSELAYRTLTEHAPEAIVVMDVDEGRFVDMNQKALQLFKIDREQLLASDPADVSPAVQPDGRASDEAAREYLAEALQGAAPRFEWEHMDTEGNVIPCEVCLVRLPSMTRRLVRGSLIDISYKHRARERQRRVLHELDHRVKNNLAAVLALLDRTFESATSLEDFREAYTGRIRALASAHDALAQRHWKGVDIGAAAHAVLAPYGSDRITTGGPTALLPPNQAAPLGIVLHELATNAVKYGALSTAGGRVDVRWERVEERVDVSWIESGGPPVGEPDETGLGLKLLVGLIEYEVGGTVDMRFEPGGFRCKLSLPLAAYRTWDDPQPEAVTSGSAAGATRS